MNAAWLLRTLALAAMAALEPPAVTASPEPAPAVEHSAADERAVADGGAALDRWWPNGYPWYDAADDRAGGDGIASIDVSPSWWESLNLNWNWSGPGSLDLSWLWDVLKWLAWIAIAALAAYLIYLVVRLVLDPEYRLAWAGGKGDSAHELAQQRRRTEALPLSADEGPLDLLEAARRAAAAGHYNEAIVYLFSHQLVELDKRHRIHLTRGKTNRQYLREIGAGGSLGRLFYQTMVAFEDAFFGHHDIGRERFEACFHRLNQFDEMTAQPPLAALAAPVSSTSAAVPGSANGLTPLSAPTAENRP
jgi:hypothetical protein